MTQAPDASGKGRQESVARVRQSRGDLAAAVAGLENAHSAAAPGREQEWQSQVRGSLENVAAALRAQIESNTSDDSLLSDIVREQPRLSTRVRRLHQQQKELLQLTEALIDEVEDDDDAPHPDVGDIRQRLAWLLAAVRHQRARETDLVFEAYETDLGVGD